MEGYIKLHRQIFTWEWYDDSNTFRMFIHLLLKANHEDREWRGNLIKRGQLFTSIGHLSSELKLSDKATRIAINKLISTNEIISEGANNGTKITVCNYDTYQQNSETEGRTKGQTKGKQRATNKNDKNDKKENQIDFINNVEKNWRDDFLIYKEELLSEYNKTIKDNSWILEREQYHPNLNILLTLKKSCVDFWGTEKGWKNKKASKTKEIDWRSTFNNALTQKINQVYNQNIYGKTEQPKSHVFTP